MARIGAHFHVDHPLNDAIARGADAAQFFLGDPQGWKGPVIPGGDPSALRDAFAAARRLTREEGILAGGSCGTALVAGLADGH